MGLIFIIPLALLYLSFTDGTLFFWGIVVYRNSFLLMWDCRTLHWLHIGDSRDLEYNRLRRKQYYSSHKPKQ